MKIYLSAPPAGLRLIGRAFDEAGILRVASALDGLIEASIFW